MSIQEFNKFRERQLQQVRDFLSGSGHGEDIGSIVDYCELADVTVSRSESVEDWVSSISRFYPYNNQNVALVLEEPGINEFDMTENRELSKKGGNIEEMVGISANFYIDYISGRDGNQSNLMDYILKPLFNITSIGPNNESLDEYLGYLEDESSISSDLERQVNLRSGVWDDLYVTNRHMTAEFGSTGLSNEESYKKVEALLFEELHLLGPELIICAGQGTINAICDYYQYSIINGKKHQEGPTASHGSLYSTEKGPYIIPILHPSGLNNGRYKKSDKSRYKKSIKKVAKQKNL